jgi:hypothetical protein
MAKNITAEQLVEKLKGIKGSQFAQITAMTLVKLTGGKKNPLQGRVQKVASANVILNHVYENSVNNQLEREGKDREFKVCSRTWGSRIKGTTLVEHKGSYYVETKVERSDGYYYLVDGRNATAAEIDAINASLPKKTNNTGTKKQIFLRDYKVDGILSMTFGGKQFTVSKK